MRWGEDEEEAAMVRMTQKQVWGVLVEEAAL
jgi:hypothetical protein